MPFHIEEVTSEVTVLDGDMPLSEAQVEKLVKLVRGEKGVAKILPDGKIMLQIDSNTRENARGTPDVPRKLPTRNNSPKRRLCTNVNDTNHSGHTSFGYQAGGSTGLGF